MNNSEFFISSLRPADFVSIFSSINILSNIFYQEKLLTLNDKYKAVPVVNSLCQYLHDANNSENAVIALGKKMLNKTHFYGSNANETLHFKYVDAELDNIIASVAFSKFGNTFGYLSAIVNGTNNLTLSFMKQKIENDLGLQTYLNEDFTISRLTHLSIRRITEKLIFSLFPELTENSQLRIIDVDYIYAQAGLMFARSAQVNSENSSFEEYIAIAQSIEQGVRLGHLNNSALQIFQLPALLYYTHRSPEVFKDGRFDILVNDKNFWDWAFYFLFSHLNDEQEKIYGIQKNNPVYHFKKALFQFRNRTEYAEYLLRRMCPLADESEYEAEVETYKFNNADYHCKTNNFHMPDINELFSQQNEHIAHLYANVEKEIARAAFNDEITKFIEQPNITVSPIQIQFKSRCGEECAFFKPNVHEDSVVFEVSDGINPVPYALIRNNNSITLHSSKNGTESFLEEIGLHSVTIFTLPSTHKPLKRTNETFNKLLENLVEPKRQAFYNRLQRQGYEPSRGESIIDFLKTLIPFYTCVQTARTETVVTAVCACIVDSLVLIPLVGEVASTGIKFLNAAVKPLLMAFQSSLKAFTIGQFIGITLKTFAAQTAIEFSSLITREMFGNFGIAIARTLDPGIELSYTLGKGGVKAVTKCFKIIGRKVTVLTKMIKSLNTVKQTVVRQAGTFEGHNVFVSSISGQDGYGVKYINYQEKKVYLRRLRGYQKEVPVVLVSDAGKNEKIYQIINLDTGELKTKRWVENADGILEVKTQPLRVRLKTIQVEGLSGRGRIANAQRAKDYINLLERREECVDILKTFMNENEATEIVRHYVFEDPRRTFADLANEWKLTNFLPEWSSRYRIDNVQLYEKLRYNNFVEESLTEDVAVERVRGLYGENYMNSVSLVNPNALFDYFKTNTLYSSISFVDLYSFTNLMTTRFPIINLYSREALHMRKAIYRIALRKIDYHEIESPATFYKLESKTSEEFGRLLSGNSLEITKFTVFNQELPGASDFLLNNLVYNSNAYTKVVFEAVVNDPYLVINPKDLLPVERNEFIFLPHNKFKIDSITPMTLADNNVMLIRLVSERMSKSKLLAHFMNNIKKIEECEAQLISNR